MPQVLRTLRDTVFKTKPLQSSALSASEKQEIDGGKEFQLHSYVRARDHVRFALLKDSFKGKNTWYAFGQHVQILADGAKPTTPVFPKPRPRFVRLPVPYRSQMDNYHNPSGACNVTSIGMCLEYFKVARRTQYRQFEDELYSYMINKGYSRHDPYDLAKVVREYGCRDDFTKGGSIERAKDWLAQGKPAIIHGYFTSFGHILVLVGYDDTGFFVHDPYGEWFSTGYRNDLSGSFLHYSYRLIRRVCIPDGQFWVHHVSR